VDGRHEPLLDAVRLVDDLGERGQAVGGAARVRHDVGPADVLLVIHPHDVHRSILGRGRDDDLLRPPGEMGARLRGGREHARGLADVIGPDGPPRDLGGVHAREELDGSRGRSGGDDEGVRGHVGRDGAGVLPVDGIVLEEVRRVVEGEEGVVHRHGQNVARVFHRRAGDEATDAAEAVDSDLDCHSACCCDEMIGLEEESIFFMTVVVVALGDRSIKDAPHAPT